MRSSFPRPPFSLRRRSALTLVEMLISLAVTLVMMAAVVNLFADMSASIRNRRAGIELGGRLRQTRQQLVHDLAGATCPTVPWQKPGNGVGYIELIEGEWSDKRPSILTDGILNETPANLNLELDYSLSQVPSGGPVLAPHIAPGPNVNAAPQPGDVTNGRALGDYDDVLAMTVRSEDEPFLGVQPLDPDGDGVFEKRTLESNLAEVVWFSLENPQDNPNTPDVDERLDPATGVIREPGMRNVYRRVLLVAPWVQNNSGAVATSTVWPNSLYLGTGLTMPQKRERLREFQQEYGISARVELTSDFIILNTLDDLTKRENRFAHRPAGAPLVEATPENPSLTFPHVMDEVAADSRWLMLENVLAFDLRVFDPGAPLLSVAGATVEPADPAWAKALVNTSNNLVNPEPIPVGYGAYVDMGYGYDNNRANSTYVYIQGLNSTISTISPPQFNVPHRVGWHPLYDHAAGNLANPYRGYPCVYDAWSLHYENDGIEQDQNYWDNLFKNPPNERNAWNAIVGILPLDYRPAAILDQGTNNVDDDGDLLQSIGLRPGGVDDPLERETSPPYPTPLRGLKVILRTYEPDSRQIRETSVTHSFVPQ